MTVLIILALVGLAMYGETWDRQLAILSLVALVGACGWLAWRACQPQGLVRIVWRWRDSPDDMQCSHPMTLARARRELARIECNPFMDFSIEPEPELEEELRAISRAGSVTHG